MVLHHPRFITWPITSCLDPLHDRLHPALIHYIDYCILSWSSTCATPCDITCFRIHFMLPNPLHPLHAPESITCGQCSPLSINWKRAWPAAAQQISLCRPTGANSALGKQSFSRRIQFARQYSSVQQLDLQHTDEVAASTRSLHKWSNAMQMVVGTSGAWNIQDVSDILSLLNIHSSCHC